MGNTAGKQHEPSAIQRQVMEHLKCIFFFIWKEVWIHQPDVEQIIQSYPLS